MEKLTDKQIAFCKEYIVDWNASRAARDAGYSAKTAKEIGSQNLTKPAIRNYIDKLQKDIKKVAGISILSNLRAFAEVIKNPESKESDRIQAVEVINKMLGFNAAEKTETTNKHEVINVSFSPTGVKPVQSESDITDA